MTKTLKNDYKLRAFLDFNKKFTVVAAKWLLQQLLKNAICRWILNYQLTFWKMLCNWPRKVAKQLQTTCEK